MRKTTHESLFNSSIVYITLYQTTGAEADNYIRMIDAKGAKWTLETMLINLTLTDVSRVHQDKPWGMFSDTFQMGDYTLWWDRKNSMVAIIEQYDTSDPYDNE